MSEIPDEVKQVFAGIDVNTIGPEPEGDDTGPWSPVPNRKTRRGHQRGVGAAKPFRSRCTRKRP